MKIIFIYGMINVWQPFLNLGSVAFRICYLNFMELTSMTALEFLLGPINSFKMLNYCKDAYLVFQKDALYPNLWGLCACKTALRPDHSKAELLFFLSLFDVRFLFVLTFIRFFKDNQVATCWESGKIWYIQVYADRLNLCMELTIRCKRHSALKFFF